MRPLSSIRSLARVCIAAAVILLAGGPVFAHHPGVLRMTGGPDANVFVDGSFVGPTMESLGGRFVGLLHPGTYQVRVELNGEVVFSDSLDILSRLVTDASFGADRDVRESPAGLTLSMPGMRSGQGRLLVQSHSKQCSLSIDTLGLVKVCSNAEPYRSGGIDPGDYEMAVVLPDTALTVVVGIRPDSLTQLVVSRRGETRQKAIGLWDIEEWIDSHFLGDALSDGKDLLPYEVPPGLDYTSPPVYRHDARSDSTGGRVLLKLAIDAAGRVMGVHVVGSDPGLREAAVLSAVLWDYIPATLMGSYVPSHMYWYVTFDPPEESVELERAMEWRTRFDTPPRLVHEVTPEYPEQAWLAEFEGVVRAEIRIDATGKVVRVIPRDGPRAFHDAVMSAVLQWEFEPALLDGIPIPVRVLMPVRFELRD